MVFGEEVDNTEATARGQTKRVLLIGRKFQTDALREDVAMNVVVIITRAEQGREFGRHGYLILYKESGQVGVGRHVGAIGFCRAGGVVVVGDVAEG